MSQMPDWGQFDPKLVDGFLRKFGEFTFQADAEQRSRVLDDRIRHAALSLADKIEVFNRLAPRADVTDPREELRMERLLLSISSQDLPLFKFALEYDGDYKDVAEYVFHDIDDKKRQDLIIGYFRAAQKQIGVKVLTDVDDTMLASSGQVDLYTLQKLLTHKSAEMTQRYAHLRDEALHRTSNLAGDIFAQAIASQDGAAVRDEAK
jgi:hypothetical protein